MPSDEQADVIARLPEIEVWSILDAMPAAEARSDRGLMAYAPFTNAAAAGAFVPPG